MTAVGYKELALQHRVKENFHDFKALDDFLECFVLKMIDWIRGC